jgi:hypothetical protein
MFRARHAPDEQGGLFCMLALRVTATQSAEAARHSGRPLAPLMLSDLHPSPRALEQWAELSPQLR